MPFDHHSSSPGRSGQVGFTGGLSPDSEPRKARLRGSVVVIALAVAIALGAWIWHESDMGSTVALPQWVERIERLLPFGPAEAAAAERPLFAALPGTEPLDEPILTPPTDDAPSPATADATETGDSSGTSEFADEAAELQRQARVRDAMEQGQLYTRIGRYRQASLQFAEAVRLDPNNAQARYRLGLTCVRSGQHAAARRQKAALEKLDTDLANLLGSLIR